MPDHLLVPIALEALVVNENDRHNTTWSVIHKQYANMATFEPIEPPPFAHGNDRPRLGVTLHWALPDALTRGKPDPVTKKLIFPLIPNRWLVLRAARLIDVRVEDDGSTTETFQELKPLRAWVVESDFQDPDASSNLFPSADGATITRLGFSAPLENWTARNSAPFLTALGGDRVSDPSFAAYTANVENVLSFNDRLEDLATDQRATLTYMVVGWHSRPDLHDPLRSNPRSLKAWQALLKDYGWSVSHDPDASQRPAATLYHGMITRVNWTGFAGAPQPFARGVNSPFAGSAIASRFGFLNPAFGSSPNDAQKFADIETPSQADLPQIAFGNSIEDAVASLVEYLSGFDDKVDVATMLETLARNLAHTYDQPGGQVELDQKIHQEWFVSSQGELSWEVTAPQPPVPDPPPALTPPPMDAARIREKLESLPMSAATGAPTAAQTLDNLNRLQAAFDANQRKLAGMRRDLYNAWWKSKRLANLGFGAPVVNRSAFDRLAMPAQADLDQASTALRVVVASAGLALLPRPGARFFRPADPVALVYGLRRSSKHGSDGAFSSDGTLQCRFDDEIVDALGTVTSTTLRNSGLFPFDAAALAKLPSPAVMDLAAEMVLLSPDCAERIGSLSGGTTTAASVTAKQAMIWQDRADLKITPAEQMAAAGFTGVRPSPLGIEAWAQPWTPLFMSWQVTWYPTPYPAAANPGVLSDWRFNGLDYDWTGVSQFDHSKAVPLQGRSLLAPVSTKGLQKSIAALIPLLDEKDPPPQTAAEIVALNTTRANRAASLKRLQDILESADLLAQPLTGFHDQLTGFDRTEYFDPRGPGANDLLVKSLLGDVPRMAPIVFRNRNDVSRFFPVRAGHFRLEQLWIIDAFGQVFDPIAERGEIPASFAPIRGRGLTAVGLAQLPEQSASDAPPTTVGLTPAASATTNQQPRLRQRTDTQMLQLPPRIVQPSRLVFRFARENAAVSPMCGWLLPNHFDKSLTVYSADGTSLGATMFADSVAANAIRWEPAVGSPAITDPQQIADPDLQHFVVSLLNKTNAGLAFEDLLEAIDRTLWTVDPLGQRGNGASVLIGRPIAIVRAMLQLEMATSPLQDPYFDLQPAESPTRGFTDIQFKVALGNIDLRDDGTLGFFDGADYSHFHAVHPIERDHPDYVIQPGDQPLTLRPTWPEDPDRNTKTRFVTLLVDPRGTVTASTGALPAKAVLLPTDFIEQSLQRLDVTFRVGPLLNEAATLRMPLPADIRGGWSWIQESGVGIFANPATVEPASGLARLSGTPVHIREGWLKLTGALGQKAN